MSPLTLRREPGSGVDMSLRGSFDGLAPFATLPLVISDSGDLGVAFPTVQVQRRHQQLLNFIPCAGPAVDSVTALLLTASVGLSTLITEARMFLTMLLDSGCTVAG